MWKKDNGSRITRFSRVRQSNKPLTYREMTFAKAPYMLNMYVINTLE